MQRSTGGVFRKAELAARGCKREEREAKETGRERRDDVLTVIGCGDSLSWTNWPVAAAAGGKEGANVAQWGTLEAGEGERRKRAAGGKTWKGRVLCAQF